MDGMRSMVVVALLATPLPLLASGHVFWKADFSCGIDGFCIDRREGAEGSARVAVANDGSRALHIVKTNDRGYIVVTPKRAFCVADGARLQASAEVTGNMSDPDSSLGFLRMYGRSRDFRYFNGLDGRGSGGPRMDFIFNTASNEPCRKVCRYFASETAGTNVTPAIVVAGTRSDSVWRMWQVEDLSAAERRWRKYIEKVEPSDHSSDRQDDNSFTQTLAGDIDHTACVEKENGYAVLKVDGQTVAPVLFKGKIAADGAKNLYCGRRMEDVGVRLQVVSLRFGDAPGMPGVWSAGDSFDVESAVIAVRDAMRMAKDSLFMLTLILDAYPEFAGEHPDEVWTTVGGRAVWGNHVHANYSLDPRTFKTRHWPWVSNHSRVWRDAVKRHITTLVGRLKSEGLAKRIVGIHLAGFHDHQFATRHLDYSVPATEGFLRWQMRKYGEIKWPTPPKYADSDVYLVPGRNQAQIDFLSFLKEGPFEVQEELARHAKNAFGKDIVAVRWCMGAFGGTYGSAYDITAFAHSKDIDILVAQPSYPYRTPGVAIGLRLPDASFHKNGKLFLNEFDLRTYGAVSGRETELRVTGLSQAMNFPMWKSIYHKLAGQMIAERMGWWFYDMAGGWFEPPEIAADIGNTLTVLRTLNKKPPMKWRPSAAVVIDEEGARLRNTPASYYNIDEETLFGDQMRVLGSSGVPYDVWLADDIIHNPSLALPYKTIVFAGMYCIDEKRAEMLKRLKSGNRSLVFLSGTGVSGGSETTGFCYVRKKPPQSHETVAEYGEDCNVANVLESKRISKALAVEGVSLNAWLPRCDTVAETPDMRVLARFSSDGTPAICECRFDGWTGVAVGSAGGLSPQCFNRIVRDAGGYVPVESGRFQVNMNGDFVSLHCIKSSRCNFRLPFRCRVRDMETGNLHEKADSFSLQMTVGETRWFAFSEQEERIE